VGLCFVNLPGQFVGPLGELAGGIDISLPVTLGLASVVYLTLLSLFPESAAVFGPNDPRSKGASTMAKPELRQPA
jgi:purine-cytosine permease-like protein